MTNLPITFVCWKWHVPNNARLFGAKHVNVVHAMIARWYQRPFRFVCITDDPKGLDKRIEAMPMPAAARKMLAVKNPMGKWFPGCYCRLWVFSTEAAALGERIFQLDIDSIIVGDLAPLIDRTEDFVGWSDGRFGWEKIAGAAFLLRTGSMPELWDEFDPVRSPALAFAGGYQGSDQGWMSYKIAKLKANRSRSRFIGEWRDEGLIKLNWIRPGAEAPPPGARIVFTNGKQPPWNKDLRNRYPWIRQHWKNEGKE